MESSDDLIIATQAISKVAAGWFTTGGLDNLVRAEQFASDLIGHGYRIVPVRALGVTEDSDR